MKAIAIVLLISLILPNVLQAAPSDEVRTQAAKEAQQTDPQQSAEQKSNHSPGAQKAYLGTGIGTLAAGGAFLALGIGVSGSNGIGAEEVGTLFSAVGGVFLAASAVLWILYFQ